VAPLNLLFFFRRLWVARLHHALEGKLTLERFREGVGIENLHYIGQNNLRSFTSHFLELHSRNSGHRATITIAFRSMLPAGLPRLGMGNLHRWH